MFLYPYLPHVHVNHAADFELDADKDGQPIHSGASSENWAMRGAVLPFDPALKWCMRGLKLVETQESIDVFDVAAVDLTSASSWDCFSDPTVKPKPGESGRTRRGAQRQ